MQIPSPVGFDAIVLALPHSEYQELDILDWLGSSRPLLLDANNVLSKNTRDKLRSVGIQLFTIGRGKGL